MREASGLGPLSMPQQLDREPTGSSQAFDAGNNTNSRTLDTTAVFDFEEQFGCATFPLHYACRTGNLQHVEYLTTVLRYPVNQVDTHDATPLYLAALVGRQDICQYLLEHGAHCEGEDAARVFYVALNDELRVYLQNWSLTAAAARDPFVESYRLAYHQDDHESKKDATTVKVQLDDVDGTMVHAAIHKLVLFARCPALYQLVDAVNGILVVSTLSCVDANMSATCWELLLEYLYTGRLEIVTGSSMDRQCMVQGLSELASDCQLADLAEALKLSETDNVKTDGSSCPVSILHKRQLQTDMAKLAELISEPLAEPSSTTGGLFSSGDMTDVTLLSHNNVFCVNRFRLAQSEYLDRALSGNFREAHEMQIDLSHLVASPEIVQLAIQWMYCHDFCPLVVFDDNANASDSNGDKDRIPLEVAVEVLEFGYSILCPALSAYTANAVLIPAIDGDNALDMLQLARLYNLERLEDKCVVTIGCNFDATMTSKPQLRELLVDEIRDIRQGGDETIVDVPLAAEIRREIKAHNIRTDLGPDDCRRRLGLLQDVLNGALDASSCDE